MKATSNLKPPKNMENSFKRFVFISEHTVLHQKTNSLEKNQLNRYKTRQIDTNEADQKSLIF